MVYKIAEAFLTFGAVRHYKLQKLCYFSYAWYLTFFGEKLFRQKFYADDEGPVCPELYEKYIVYGDQPIPRSQKKICDVIADPEVREFIEAVYDAHGYLNAGELRRLACSEEPWLLSRQRLAQGRDNAYDDEEIVNWNTKKVLNELSKESILV